MNSKTKQKLLQIADSIEALSMELRHLIDEEETSKDVSPSKKNGDDNELKEKCDEIISRIKTSDRETSKNLLSQLKQIELSEIFAKTGGASKDKKKKKEWLIERILWNIFDFEEGHNILKK